MKGEGKWYERKEMVEDAERKVIDAVLCVIKED
jgi:hypothetical protein